MRIWIIAATSLALFAAACGETKTQRASSGAAGGAILGAVVGGPIGALVGAGLGGAGGAWRDELRQSGKEIAVAGGGGATEPVDRTPAAPAQRQSELTNREVREAQIALMQMGMYEGEIDGLYGRLTIAAVKQFQASRDGLPYTGTLDERTLQQIRTVAAAKSGPANGEKTRPTATEQPPETREAAAARESRVD